MHVNKFLFNSLNLKEKVEEFGYDVNEEFVCSWCGKKHNYGFKKNIFSSNFTNWDLMQAPNKKYVCEYCAAPFIASKLKDIKFSNGKESNLRRALIYYHFIATPDKFIAFKNDDLRGYLMNPPVEDKEPFIFCITYSYKKHNSFRSVINASRDKFIIRAETKTINFDRKKAEKMLPVLWELYLHFTKEEITEQHFPTTKIFKMGVDNFENLKRKQEGLDYNFRELLVKLLDSDKRRRAVKKIRKNRKENKKKKKKIKKFIEEEIKEWKKESEKKQLKLF